MTGRPHITHDDDRVVFNPWPVRTVVAEGYSRTMDRVGPLQEGSEERVEALKAFVVATLEGR